MKTLILFRHGKSDWGEETLPDHDRPLAKRGVKASKAMGRVLRRAGQIPASAVTSSALRARTTLERAMEAGQWTCTVRVEDALYGASVRAVLEVIQAERDETDRLLLVGHEPTWSEAAGRLIGGGELTVPTACMLRVDIEAESWKDVDFGAGRLVWHIPPRFFTDGDFEL